MFTINTLINNVPDYAAGKDVIEQLRRDLLITDPSVRSRLMKTKEEIVYDYFLKNGIKISRPGDHHINEIAIDALYSQTSDGPKLRWGISSSSVKRYFNGVDSIENFASTHTLPSALNPAINTYRIVMETKAFSYAYSDGDGGSITKGVKPGSVLAGFNAALGTRNDDKSISYKRSDIYVSHPAINSGPKVTFVSRESDVLTHEYSHSVGNAADFHMEKTAKNYAPVNRQYISDYGRQAPTEHFAEALSLYIQTGQATPEFISYLKYIGIEKK